MRSPQARPAGRRSRRDGRAGCPPNVTRTGWPLAMRATRVIRWIDASPLSRSSRATDPHVMAWQGTFGEATRAAVRPRVPSRSPLTKLRGSNAEPRDVALTQPAQFRENKIDELGCAFARDQPLRQLRDCGFRHRNALAHCPTNRLSQLSPILEPKWIGLR